jgi:hypothetical protein
MTSSDTPTMDMDAGPQPIDAFLSSHGFSNHDVVAAAAGSGLTHKVVAKARKGRALTARAQKKILSAVAAHCRSMGVPERAMCDLFIYRGRS